LSTLLAESDGAFIAEKDFLMNAGVIRTATWPMIGDGQGVRRIGARATAPRWLLLILCISQVATHGMSADPHSPAGRVNDADLGRRLAAWPDSMTSRPALTAECPLELYEGPHRRQQQIRHRRIFSGERQALVIQFEANSVGRQLMENSTEITEVASVSHLSYTRDCINLGLAFLPKFDHHLSGAP
jgi:hypothetical protein